MGDLLVDFTASVSGMQDGSLFSEAALEVKDQGAEEGASKKPDFQWDAQAYQSSKLTGIIHKRRQEAALESEAEDINTDISDAEEEISPPIIPTRGALPPRTTSRNRRRSRKDTNSAPAMDEKKGERRPSEALGMSTEELLALAAREKRMLEQQELSETENSIRSSRSNVSVKSLSERRAARRSLVRATSQKQSAKTIQRSVSFDLDACSHHSKTDNENSVRSNRPRRKKGLPRRTKSLDDAGPCTYACSVKRMADGTYQRVPRDAVRKNPRPLRRRRDKAGRRKDKGGRKTKKQKKFVKQAKNHTSASLLELKNLPGKRKPKKNNLHSSDPSLMSTTASTEEESDESSSSSDSDTSSSSSSSSSLSSSSSSSLSSSDDSDSDDSITITDPPPPKSLSRRLDSTFASDFNNNKSNSPIRRTQSLEAFSKSKRQFAGPRKRRTQSLLFTKPNYKTERGDLSSSDEEDENNIKKEISPRRRRSGRLESTFTTGWTADNPKRVRPRRLDATVTTKWSAKNMTLDQISKVQAKQAAFDPLGASSSHGPVKRTKSHDELGSQSCHGPCRHSMITQDGLGSSSVNGPRRHPGRRSVSQRDFDELVSSSAHGARRHPGRRSVSQRDMASTGTQQRPLRQKRTDELGSTSSHGPSHDNKMNDESAKQKQQSAAISKRSQSDRNLLRAQNEDGSARKQPRSTVRRAQSQSVLVPKDDELGANSTHSKNVKRVQSQGALQKKATDGGSPTKARSSRGALKRAESQRNQQKHESKGKGASSRSERTYRRTSSQEKIASSRSERSVRRMNSQEIDGPGKGSPVKLKDSVKPSAEQTTKSDSPVTKTPPGRATSKKSRLKKSSKSLPTFGSDQTKEKQKAAAKMSRRGSMDERFSRRNMSHNFLASQTINNDSSSNLSTKSPVPPSPASASGSTSSAFRKRASTRSKRALERFAKKQEAKKAAASGKTKSEGPSYDWSTHLTTGETKRPACVTKNATSRRKSAKVASILNLRKTWEASSSQLSAVPKTIS